MPIFLSFLRSVVLCHFPVCNSFSSSLSRSSAPLYSNFVACFYRIVYLREYLTCTETGTRFFLLCMFRLIECLGILKVSPRNSPGASGEIHEDPESV